MKTSFLIFIALFVTTNIGAQENNIIYADEVSVTPNSTACVNFYGNSSDTIVSMQVGFRWDPEILSFTSFAGTDSLNGIAINSSNVANGELQTVWFDSQLMGILEFNYRLCFQAIGEPGDVAEIVIPDEPDYKFEIIGENVETLNFERRNGKISIIESQEGCDELIPLFCLEQILIPLDENGEAVVFVDDLLLSELDPNGQYSVQFSGFQPDSSLSFNYQRINLDCDDFLDSIAYLSIVNVCDSLFDVCTTKLISFDEFNVCSRLGEISNDEILVVTKPKPPGQNSYGNLKINGQEASAYDRGIYGLPKSSIMDFDNVLTFEPSDDIPLAGLSTLDEVLLLKQLLHLDSLYGPQLIAADIDQSGDLSFTRDFIKHRQLVLGQIQALPGDNYFMIPRNNQLLEDLDPFNFDNNYDTYSFHRSEIDTSQGIVMDIYKYGDLNDNFASEPRSVQSINLEADNAYLQAGKSYRVKLHLKDFELSDGFYGFQFSLSSQDASLAISNHSFEDKLKFFAPSKQQLNISVVSPKLIESFEIEIEIEANKSANLSELLALNTDFVTEFIEHNMDVSSIQLSFKDPLFIGDDKLDVIQISPNPARDYVTIKIANENIGSLFEVFNSLGQLEYSKAVKGNELILSCEEFGMPGLKFVSLDNKPISKLVVLY